jgi:putative tricarboxylic transport membrane protein
MAAAPMTTPLPPPHAAEPADPAAASAPAAAAGAAAPATTAAGPARPSWAGPRAVGFGLLAIGVVALIATAAIPAARDGWSLDGPRFFPLLAALGLIVSSAAFLARTVVRQDVELARHAAEEARETDWRLVGLVAALLLGYVTAFEALGYIASTAVFFTLAARVLGSRSPVRDAVAGAALAVALDFVFTQLLAVRLPAGLLGF